MMKEIWKDIAGYEGKYQVSNLGNVKSLSYNKTGREKPLLPKVNKYDYLEVTLFKNGKRKYYRVNRLVAEAFLDKRNFKYVDEDDRIANLDLENLQVNHLIEGKEGKEDNCVDNLEWCTPKYNANYGTHNERVGKAQRNDPNKSKIICQYDLNGNFIQEWPSVAEIKRQLGYNQGNISACCRGERKTAHGYIWKYKGGDK